MTSSSKAFTPVKIGPIELRNRLIKAATNEGMAKKGIVTKGLANWHAQISEGGVGMSTVAYCATSDDGKTFVDQACLNEASMDDFRALTDGVHKGGAAACAQITHAGCFSFLPKDILQSKPISASGGFNKCGVMTRRFTKRKMTRSDMDAIAAEFVTAAERARECGFDAVEVHMGHGYLLSQFISPFYNKRGDAYGGNIDKRMTFPKEVLSKVLDAVGKDIAVIVKYSMTDGRSGGNTIKEGLRIAETLEQSGAHMAVLSNGMNVESISSMFGSSLPEQVRQPPKNPIIRFALEWQKISEFKKVEFSENYLLELAKQVRERVAMPLCYIGGIQSLDNVNEVMDAGFDAIAMGRPLIADPDLPNQFKSGQLTESSCTACNQCVTMMYSPGGTGCILRAPNNAELNQIKASETA